MRSTSFGRMNLKKLYKTLKKFNVDSPVGNQKDCGDPRNPESLAISGTMVVALYSYRKLLAVLDLQMYTDFLA